MPMIKFWIRAFAGKRLLRHCFYFSHVGINLEFSP